MTGRKAHSVAYCDHCRKMLYATRSDARRVARMAMPSERLSVYACPVHDGYHNGHLPPWVRSGEVSRDCLRRQR